MRFCGRCRAVGARCCLLVPVPADTGALPSLSVPDVTPVTVVVVEFAQPVMDNPRHAQALRRTLRRPAGAAAPGAASCSSLVVASVGLAAYDARRDAREHRHRPRAGRRAGGRRRARRSSRRSPSRSPARRIQPYAERVRARRGRRLRGRDGARPDPLQPPRPGQHRQAVRRRPRRRARRASRSPSSTPAPSARRCAPWCRSLDGDEVVALVSVGITIARSTSSLRDDLVLIGFSRRCWCSVSAWPGPWLVGRRLRGRPTGSARRRSPGCTSTTRRSWAPSARDCCCSTTTAGCSWSTTRRRRLLDLPDDVVGRPLADLGLAPGLVARRWAGPRRPTTSTSPATGCWSSARRRPGGRGGRRRGGHPARPHRAAVR